MLLKYCTYPFISSIFFSIVYYSSTLVEPLTTWELLSVRMTGLILILLIYLYKSPFKHRFLALLLRLKKQPWLCLIVIFNTLNSVSQMYLYLWAPMHGYAASLSIGYLLLPLTLVFIGKLCFNEKFTVIKWSSIIIAVVGVAISFFLSDNYSWVVLAVPIGYGTYFYLRKKFHLDSIFSFLLENLLLLPIFCYFLFNTDFHYVYVLNQYVYLYLTIIIISSSLAFLFYMLASNLLPLNIFGLLSYSEPLMMLIVALILGERIEFANIILLGFLVISILLLALDLFITIKQYASLYKS